MSNKIRGISEISMAAALSVLLSFIVLFKMPQGGSVSLSMIPIIIVAYRRGGASGMITGAVYGILAVFIDGVIIHPASIILDYVLAFSLVGICGFFNKSVLGIICGIFTGILGRFLSSLISGGILFANFAPAGQNPWVYSAIYQITYLFPEFIICTVIAVILYIKSPKIYYK